MLDNTQTASITVLSLEADQPEFSSLRWFQLPARMTLATYAATPLDVEEFGPSVPHPEAVKEIEAAHPGHTLVYLSAN